MPIESIATVDAQYRALREEAGLAGPIERGLLAVRGPDGAEYLQGQLTNDIESLTPGSGCYAALLDRKGRMQSDMRVLRTPQEDEILIETEPDRLAAVRRHLEMYSVGREVEIADRSAESVLLRLAGPASIRALGDAPLGPEHANRAQRIGETDCLVVATDEGADVLAPAERAETVREAILAAGAEPVGAGALEIIRVEAGRPRFGAEMAEGTMPQEAGINDRAVDFTKGCYIGQETVARLHYRGKPNRHLRRLRPDREVRAGAEVTLGDRALGTVGTAVLSPREGPLALAILRREAEPGARVTIGDVEATVEETT